MKAYFSLLYVESACRMTQMMIAKDGSHSESHRDLWVCYLTHVQGEGEMNTCIMEIKNDN